MEKMMMKVIQKEISNYFFYTIFYLCYGLYCKSVSNFWRVICRRKHIGWDMFVRRRKIGNLSLFDIETGFANACCGNEAHVSSFYMWILVRKWKVTYQELNSNYSFFFEELKMLEIQNLIKFSIQSKYSHPYTVISRF
jgi:hypothetical protein